MMMAHNNSKKGTLCLKKEEAGKMIRMGVSSIRVAEIPALGNGMAKSGSVAPINGPAKAVRKAVQKPFLL